MGRRVEILENEGSLMFVLDLEYEDGLNFVKLADSAEKDSAAGAGGAAGCGTAGGCGVGDG